MRANYGLGKEYAVWEGITLLSWVWPVPEGVCCTPGERQALLWPGDFEEVFP